jgi:aldose 1-epimerase
MGRMTASIELACEGLRCQIAPALGGCIAGLWLGDVPVLRSTPAAQLATARQAGSYPLVPFSNRMGHATLQWQGTSHPLVRNNGDEPHAIHGVGWQRPWTLLDADDRLALLSYEHRPDAAWPFAFDASQTFRIAPGSLELTLSVTNQAERPAPLGMGWHPYFVKRPGSRLRFEATGRWEMGADKLPTHRSASAGLDASCDTLDVDHCFDGWHGSVLLQRRAAALAHQLGAHAAGGVHPPHARFRGHRAGEPCEQCAQPGGPPRQPAAGSGHPGAGAR